VLGDFAPGLLGAVTDADAPVVADALADGIGAGLLETTAGRSGSGTRSSGKPCSGATVPHLVDAIHRRAATALAADPAPDAQQLERRAHHLLAAGAEDQAASLLTAAADARLREHALLGAERLARAALDHAATAAAQCDASDALARSLAAQGRWADALDVDRATDARHGETPARRHRMATCALESGRPEVAGPIIAPCGGDASPFIRCAGRAAIVRAMPTTRCALAIDASSGPRDVTATGARLGASAPGPARLSRRSGGCRGGVGAPGRPRRGTHAGAAACRRATRQGRAVREPTDRAAVIDLALRRERWWARVGEEGSRSRWRYPATAAADTILADAIERCRELRLDQLAYIVAARAMMGSFRMESVEPMLAEAEELLPTPDLFLHTAGMRADIALRRGDYATAVRWGNVAEQIMQEMPGVVPSDSSC
jgi:hypothetical protein